MCRAHYICLIFVTLTDHRNWYPCDGLPKKQRSFHLKTAERKEKNEYLVLYNVLAESVDLGIIHCTKDTKKNGWLLGTVVHRSSSSYYFSHYYSLRLSLVIVFIVSFYYTAPFCPSFFSLLFSSIISFSSSVVLIIVSFVVPFWSVTLGYMTTLVFDLNVFIHKNNYTTS